VHRNGPIRPGFMDRAGDDQAAVLCYVGATTDRPKPDPNRVGWPPLAMYDTTLAEMVSWRAGGWVNVSGSAA
jgi:hypothetical protein